MRKIFKGKKKNGGKRLVAAVLSLALLFSLVCSSGVAVFATDVGTAEAEDEPDSRIDSLASAAVVEEEPGITEYAAGDSAQFEFHYTCSTSGWAGFGANLIDENGNAISATVSSDYTMTSGRYTTTVDMPYTIELKDFAQEAFQTNGTYEFLYATVTDPNFWDEEHEFDVWDGEALVGAQELYGSEDNPVVSVTIDGTAAAYNPNYDPQNTGAVVSKTWHFTLTYADSDSVTIPIYGNAGGTIDGGGKYCPQYLQINLYYQEDREAVLNLGNGNGTYSDGDYTGSNASGGDALRYGTGGLNDYADEEGKVTIHLPSDDDLDTEFPVVDAIGTAGEEGYQPEVTIELGNAEAYDYRLIGWINIATGEYYDVSEGSAEAEISLSDDNVFYADWIAADYDHGSSDDEGLRSDTVSTSSFVTLQMFDFNELFNLYSTALTQSGTTGESWTDSGSLYSEPLFGKDADMLSPIADSFIFQNNGTTRSSVHVLSHANPAKWNLWTANGAWADDPEYNFVLDASEYWNITSPDSTILGMLYDTNEESLGVHYVGEGDYLFWVDENGYYTYDSAVSGAAYNQSDERFYVYEDKANAFFPYNDHTDSITSSNGFTNYWFGMCMEVNLYLTNSTWEGSETDPVNQIYDQDMVFDFSGDDDIMIFVDDEMLVDMSGIHSTSYSRINFSTDTVTYSMGLDDDGSPDTTGASGKYKEEELNLSAGSHTLKIFYMDRGASASNLKITFNTAPYWEYENGPLQTVTAEKVWQDAAGNAITDADELSELLDEADPSVKVGLFDVLPETCERETGEVDEQENPITETVFGYTKEEDGTYSVNYTDDSGIGHTYVFTPASGVGDTAGASLVYTETYLENGDTQTVTVTYDQMDDEGRVLDEDGYVVAWLETADDGSEVLHLRIDVQTLSKENDWSYAWELLDPDGNYEAVELSESSLYTTSSANEDLVTHPYWSVIGDAELEKILDAGGGTPILLTEAAQEAEETIGDTKEALGWVIVADESGITTKQVKFSQISLLEPVASENGQIIAYDGTYGVTSQSEVEALGSGALWYAVDAGVTHKDVNGSEIKGFYLYCEPDEGSGKVYLTLEETDDGSGNAIYSLAVTADESLKSELYYDALGELMISRGEGDPVRVEIDGNGDIQIDYAEWEAALDDVRLYTLTEVRTDGFAFTATNFLRRYFPIDEEIVTDTEDIFNRDAWVKKESVNEYHAIEIEMTTRLPIVDYEDIVNGAFTMNFHEVLDSELVLDEAEADFSVYIAGKEIDSAYYTVTIASSEDAAGTSPFSLTAVSAIEDGCSFHVDVDLSALCRDGIVTEDMFTGNTEITVFFFADLEGTGLNGTYKSTIWYDIYDGEEWLYTSNEDVVYVYTYEIDLIKYDAFALNGTDFADAGLEGAALGVFYDKACSNPVSRNGEAYTVVSEEGGRAIFYGLAEGTYYVKELEAPEGYDLSSEVLRVTLGPDLEGYAYEDVFANTPTEEKTEEPVKLTTNKLTTGGSTADGSALTGTITEEAASDAAKTEDTGTAVAPKTDDTNAPVLYCFLMILAGAALIVTIVVRRRVL